MYVEQIYTNCLAEASYYIESEGEAAVIDPIRESDPYLALAAQRGAKIKYVFETHFHADFVSGHIDLAKKTGAAIVYGPDAQTGFAAHIAKDGEVFKIGKLNMEVLHTPGHTLESSCFLLKDEQGENHAVFTGDTLFVGDVGRPDLLDGIMTKEELASKMYDSLNNKIKPLADAVIVYPGHGPGSACGKNIGKETFSTVGEQRLANYAMQEMSREEFILKITDGLALPPAYFFHDASINKNGYDNIDEVVDRNAKALSAAQVKEAIAQGASVLDVRKPEDFEKMFVKSSINIGLNGTYALWAGTLLDLKKPIVLVTEPGLEKEAVLRLARVGLENVAGYLEGGAEAWAKAGGETGTIKSVSADVFEKIHEKGGINVLDVRKKGEFESGHLEIAQHACLTQLPAMVGNWDKNDTYYVHCKSGYRSMIACSILQGAGYKNIVNIAGGFDAIAQQGIKVVAEAGASCS